MSDESRRNDVLKSYGDLKRFPKDRDLELWCDEWTKIHDDLKEAKVIEINSIKHDFYETNKKVDPLFTAAYTRDYATFEFEDLVNEFKEHYKSSPPQKQQFPRASFAATLHGHSQEEERKSGNERLINQRNKKANGCPEPCNQHPSWGKCPYIVPSIRPSNWSEDPEVRKQLDALIAANPTMARSIRSVQERVKNQQAAKSKGAPQLEFNPPAPPFAPRPT